MANIIMTNVTIKATSYTNTSIMYAMRKQGETHWRPVHGNVAECAEKYGKGKPVEIAKVVR